MSTTTPPTTTNKTTKVKFNKISCYFCNEWFENGEIESHIRACGQALEKCPNSGCGAYVTRREMDRHLNRCPGGFGEEVSSSSVTPVDNKIRELEQEILALRNTLNEEIRQRLTLITDLGQLKKRTQLGDEWTAKVGDVLNALKKCINEETDSRCVDVERCKMDIGRVAKQLGQVEAWRVELTTRLNQMEGKIKEGMEKKEEVGKQAKDSKLMVIDSRLNHLQSELEHLQLRMKEEAEPTGTIARDSIGEIEGKLRTVDMVLEDHHNSIRLFQEEVKQQVFDLRGEMDPMRMVIQEQLDKQAKLDYELKGVLNSVNETEDAKDHTQKTLEKYRRETYYTKQCLDDLQVHLQHQEKLVVIQNTAGHLIWRIDQFDKRFKESQQNEVWLKSPLFTNKPFGYTLRLEACLNGIGTWRGRNLIVGLVVVNSYYDNLLEWPCVLTGAVTLRDQPEDRSKAADFRKVVLARRKHRNYDKNQYINVPHEVLFGGRSTTTSSSEPKRCYIRDDAIFLEVRIEQQ